MIVHKKRIDGIEGVKIFYQKEKSWQIKAFRKLDESEYFTGESILEIEQRSFTGPIGALGQAIEEEREPSEKKWIIEEVMRVMSYCDGLYAAEGVIYRAGAPEEVSELQQKAIKEMQKSE